MPGTLGGTYGGGPLACAAAVATLDVIEGEGLLQNAEARGRQLVAVRVHSLNTRVWDGTIIKFAVQYRMLWRASVSRSRCAHTHRPRMPPMLHYMVIGTSCLWMWAVSSRTDESKGKVSDASTTPPWQGLLELAKRFPITDVRGRGLMVAAEFGAPDGGLTAPYGIAAKLTKACGKRNMILLSAGAEYKNRPIPAMSLFYSCHFKGGSFTGSACTPRGKCLRQRLLACGCPGMVHGCDDCCSIMHYPQMMGV